MKIIEPTAAHEAFMADLKGVLKQHQAMSAMEMLAVTSQLVGMLVALQDQTRMTPDMAIAVVQQNLELGNRQVVEGLHQTVGRA